MPPLISLPEERSYYQAHNNEPNRILCWIPAETLKHNIYKGNYDYQNGASGSSLLHFALLRMGSSIALEK